MKLDFHQRTYMRDGTHTYLWLRDEEFEGVFLTMDSGEIEVVKVPRDGEGQYRVSWGAGKVSVLTPYDPDNFEKALWVYARSTLSKSEDAKRELAAWIGGEVPTPPRRKLKRKEAPKKEPRPSAATGGLSLGDICQELGIEPSEARKALRKQFQKPGSSWAWATREDAEPVINFLRGQA